MTHANRIRLTAICFLAYALMSGLLSQIGVLSEAIAQHFQRPLIEVAASFGYLSAGITIGSFLSVIVYERLTLRQGVLFCYGLIAVALLLLLADRWSWLPYLLIAAGTCASLGVNTAAIILTLTYAPERRPTMLLITDLFFALAGVIAAPTAAYFLTRQFHWSSSYVLFAAVALAILMLAAGSRFPPTQRESAVSISRQRWPLALYLCALALPAYLLGQVTMLLWLPAYLKDSFAVSTAAAAGAISAYWLGMAVGQISLVVLLIRVRGVPMLAAAVLSSVVMSCALWLLDLRSLAQPLTFALGLANAGILKLTLAHASTLVDHPQRVVATLLMCASLGSASAPLVSAFVVDGAGLPAALYLLTACLAVAAATVLLALAGSRQRAPE